MEQRTSCPDRSTGYRWGRGGRHHRRSTGISLRVNAKECTPDVYIISELIRRRFRTRTSKLLMNKILKNNRDRRNTTTVNGMETELERKIEGDIKTEDGP